MRKIAVVKRCLDYEKKLITESVDKEDLVFFFDTEKELLENELLEEFEIVLGEPEVSTVKKMKSLRWIQMSWAGANKYTSSPELFENICLTSASGAYGYVISEYIISGILSLYRNMFSYRELMTEGKWNPIEFEDTLEGKRAIILGTGDIGKETAKRLKCFGAVTVGISKNKHNEIEYFDELYTIDCLDKELNTADLVIIALPGTPETSGMFDEDRIGKMKRNAMLVNVGRGFIVNTQVLTKALADGAISGAVIDVVDPEPLASEHPLRQMKNVVLTPHISGIGWGANKYTRKRILNIFSDNLKLDFNKETLNNIIDFNTGY